MRSLPTRLWVVVTVALAASSGVLAATHADVSLSDMSRSAERIFRGVCVSAEVGTVMVAGARLPSTTYTFEVSDSLKGNGMRTLSFRQVGTPEGGPADLGRLAGLPVYAPGLEYVIFLLPESGARLTSPAGTGRGALRVSGDEVAVPPGLLEHSPAGPPARGGAAAPSGTAAGGTAAAPGGGRVPYRALRDAVLAALGGAPPPRR